MEVQLSTIIGLDAIKNQIRGLRRTIEVDRLRGLKAGECDRPRHFVLTGNPGCGKTKTIIEYCIEKYSKKYINNQNNFLIISYSKKAQIDFITRGKKSKYPKLFSNKNIRTIHNIASHISKNKFMGCGIYNYYLN